LRSWLRNSVYGGVPLSLHKGVMGVWWGQGMPNSNAETSPFRTMESTAEKIVSVVCLGTHVPVFISKEITMSIQSNVTKALDAAHTYGEAIEQLKKDCAGKSRDDVRAAMLPAVAAHPKYKVKVVDGKLCPDSAKYETARKALQRLLNDVCGAAEHAKQEPKVKVAKAKIDAAVAIAAGMTKAEFNAWLSAVRAAVSFE